MEKKQSDRRSPSPTEGSIHEIIYLDGTRQASPGTRFANLIQSSPEIHTESHSTRRSYKSVLTNQNIESSPKKQKPKWEPNMDLTCLDDSESEDDLDMNGDTEKKVTSFNPEKVARSHTFVGSSDNSKKTIIKQPRGRTKRSACMTTGGILKRHSTSVPRSRKKSPKKLYTPTKACANSSVENDIECIGVFSPGEYKSPTAKRKKAKTNVNSDFESSQVKKIHPKVKKIHHPHDGKSNFMSPKAKESKQEKDFHHNHSSPTLKTVKHEDLKLQSPQTFGDKMKDIHLSTNGLNFFKYEEKPLVIKRGELKSFFGDICNEENIVLVAKLLSYRNRIVELTHSHGGPSNVLYYHRRYVFSKAAVTVWNAYENLTQATVQELTEYYMVSVWTAQQIVRLQGMADVRELNKCIVATLVRKRKSSSGGSPKKIDQTYQITRL